MALSIAELELQTAEFLPAREVMSGGHSGHRNDCCGGDNTWDNDSQTNYQSGISVLSPQVNAFNDTTVLSIKNV
jgi:hypothetical protein